MQQKTLVPSLMISLEITVSFVYMIRTGALNHLLLQLFFEEMGQQHKRAFVSFQKVVVMLIFLVLCFGKALNGIPPSLCGSRW